MTTVSVNLSKSNNDYISQESSVSSLNDVFLQFQEKLLALDPVAWAEAHIILDGKPFRLNGNGYRPFKDIYRYLAIEALKPDARQTVVLKSRQVGLTTTAGVLSAYFCCSGLFGKNGRPPMRIMHTLPTLELSYAYSRSKLSPILNNSIPFSNRNKSFCGSKVDGHSPSNDQIGFKQFDGGNHIWIESPGINGDRIIGRTCDYFFVDEVQSTTDAAINNGSKILIKSNYGRPGEGCMVFFGTPRQKGSSFQRRWEASTQQYFYLHCAGCDDYFPLFVSDAENWEKIWLRGWTVKCTKCGHEQDKRVAAETGKWVEHGSHDAKYVGFCINQLYMPEFSKEMILAQKPENHPSMTQKSYMNEVLGMFYSPDNSTITEDEIAKACGDTDRYMSYGISANTNRKHLLGLDWGDLSHGANEKIQGKSYSCAVVLEVVNHHLLSVVYATRLLKNDFEYKIQFVDELVRKFQIDLAVGDVGFANDLSAVLARKYPNIFMASRACAGGGLKGFYKFDPDSVPREIKFDKDNLISEVYDMLKRGHVRFPTRDYDKILWLLNHICNMDMKYTIDRSGETRGTFVKTGQTDGFAAMNNAILGYKYLQTNGFVIKNPNDSRDVNKPSEIPFLLVNAKDFKIF